MHAAHKGIVAPISKGWAHYPFQPSPRSLPPHGGRVTLRFQPLPSQTPARHQQRVANLGLGEERKEQRLASEAVVKVRTCIQKQSRISKAAASHQAWRL